MDSPDRPTPVNADAAAVELPVAWQPLTPRGVAAFAHASTGRLLLVQFVFAAMTAATVGWFLVTAWFPVVQQAIQQMPTEGQLASGVLDWRGESPSVLADNHFLALTVDLDHEGEARSPAHVQVEFGRTDFIVFSLFGQLRSKYPTAGNIGFNREELEPWWGAWKPVILTIACSAIVLGLLVTWAALATVYCFPVWLLGFFANRNLGLRASWRLAGAALLPAALFMDLGIVFYGLGVLDVVRLAAAAALHFLVGWIYIFLGPFKAPSLSEAASLKGNPFITPLVPLEPAPRCASDASANDKAPHTDNA